MGTRIVVGLIGFAIVAGLTWVGGIPFMLLALAAALIGGHEFYMMLAKGNLPAQITLGLLWLALLVLTGWLPAWFPLLTILTFGLLATLIYSLFIRERPVHFALATVFPALYLGLFLAQGVAMRELPMGFWWTMLAFIIAWSNDTFAYFVGVTLGRHKLWPRLSPKKTWEGTIGGLVGATIMSVVIVLLSPLDAPIWAAVLAGFAGGMLGSLGDLSISMIKRQVDVKDSGYFFPGHGGMLDRLDSMLFVIPFIYQITLLVGRLE